MEKEPRKTFEGSKVFRSRSASVFCPRTCVVAPYLDKNQIPGDFFGGDTESDEFTDSNEPQKPPKN